MCAAGAAVPSQAPGTLLGASIRVARNQESASLSGRHRPTLLSTGGPTPHPSPAVPPRPDRDAVRRNKPRVLDLLFKETEVRSLQELGEQKRADTIWEELAEARFPGACASIGDRHKEAGRQTEAEQWYWKGADAGDPDAMQGLVFLLAEDGLLEEATEWTERIADVGDIYAYSRLAYRFEEVGDASRAKEYFRKAVDAGLIDCYRDLIRVH